MANLPNAGDMARCVRVCGCPQSLQWLGMWHEVTAIRNVSRGGCCYFCDKHVAETVYAILGPNCAYPRSWLRRVPPPSELETVEQQDEVTA